RARKRAAGWGSLLTGDSVPVARAPTRPAFASLRPVDLSLSGEVLRESVCLVIRAYWKIFCHASRTVANFCCAAIQSLRPRSLVLVRSNRYGAMAAGGL